MKKVVNYFIILLIIAFTGCKSEETKQKEREEVYFLNEDFTIIEKSENISNIIYENLCGMGIF